MKEFSCHWITHPAALLVLTMSLAPRDQSNAADASHLNDVWERKLDCAVWTQLAPAGGAPGARRFFPHAYDTRRNRLIIAGGLGGGGTGFPDTWALGLNTAGAETWTVLSTSNPHGSGGFSFRPGIYDSFRDEFVVVHANGHIDMLNLAANTWSSPVTTGTSPEPLNFTTHSAWYDALYDRYVIFGGGSGQDTANYTDRVRALDANTLQWSDISTPPPHPIGRSLAGVAYDPAEQWVLMFGGARPGGSGSGVSLNDTWQLETLVPGHETWSEFNPLTVPRDRAQHAVTFDTRRNRMMIFSGLQYRPGSPSFAALNDTWTFDGANWSHLATAAPLPRARRGAAAVYDAVNDRLVIFGGQYPGGVPDSDGDGIPNDQDACPESDLSPTVVMAGYNTGVPNLLFADGCTISDLVAHLAATARNHGEFVSSVAHLTDTLKKAGHISGHDSGTINSAVARMIRR